MPLTAAADVDFDNSATFQSVGVYDCWEESPFRTNVLSGNVAIVDNPDTSVDPDLGQAINDSEKVLGAQRSRFGSNLFGARVDLAEVIPMTTEYKYVHVLVHRPVSGRIALVGLGKRTDRDDQTGDEEQFYCLSSNEVVANKWCDAVFAVKGNSAVEIHSLVLVPEVESPHNRTEDFLFYVDNIVVNEDLQPRFSTEVYTINFDKKTAALNRTDRYTNGITFSSPSCGSQSVEISQRSDKKLYRYIPDTYFRAKAGETVSVSVNWYGSWMHAYVYLDRNDDGKFTPAIADNGYSLTDESELMSYSFLNSGDGNYGYNSANRYIYGNNRDTRVLPDFTIPADLAAGVYRLRYKIDWDSSDPGGALSIITDGGSITDIILVVGDGQQVNVTSNQLNGDVTAEDGTLLNNYKANFGEPFTIKMAPAPKFQYSGVRVRHGVLTGDSLRHENPQYREVFYSYTEFDENDCLTLPAEVMDGDVAIEGFFVEEGTLPSRARITYNLEYNGEVLDTQTVTTMTGADYPEVTWTCETPEEYWSVTGFPETPVEGDAVITLTLEHNLPFNVSKDNNNASWYNMKISNDGNYLTHNPSSTYISLSATSASTPSATDYNSQWAFVGNAFTGFKIINRGAGEGKILSSSTNTSSNTGGYTYPIMTAEPVAATSNTYWIPTKSTNLTGNAFYLHQKGISSNKMNKRDNRLAYWTGGADAGSTFLVTLVEEVSGIGEIGIDQNDGPIEYYNLQGMKVNAENLVPGFYIMRQGNKAVKILVR